MHKISFAFLCIYYYEKMFVVKIDNKSVEKNLLTKIYNNVIIIISINVYIAYRLR